MKYPGFVSCGVGACVLFLILFRNIPCSSSYLLSSSTTLQKFITFDYSPNLQKLIDHESFRLKVISNWSEYEEEVPFVEKRLKEFKIIHEELVKNKTSELLKSAKNNHPTSVYAYLRNFMAAWQDKLENTTVYGHRLREFLEADGGAPLPNKYDLELAATSLSVLQVSYNISQEDMSKGLMLGSQGEPLNLADCCEVGYGALKAGVLEESAQWLEKCIAPVDLKNMKTEGLTFDLSRALVTLGRIKFQKDDKDRALELLEKATELDPDNKEAYQTYMQHRFGKYVTKLDELDRNKEPWRKIFFELCANASRPQQEKKPLDKRLICRYHSTQSLPYLRFREEVLSLAPYISRLFDLTGSKQLERIRNESLPNVTTSLLPGHESWYVWNGASNVIWDDESSAVANLSQRIADVTWRSVEQEQGGFSVAEPMHLIDFGMAGTYVPHDELQMSFKDTYLNLINGRRWTTVMVFMSDVPQGSYVSFPFQNITISPVKGDAVLWHRKRPSGENYPELSVGICPAGVGENIVMLKGIWQLEDTSKLLCGKTPRSSHIGAERAMEALARGWATEKPDAAEGDNSEKEGKGEGKDSKGDKPEEGAAEEKKPKEEKADEEKAEEEENAKEEKKEEKEEK